MQTARRDLVEMTIRAPCGAEFIATGLKAQENRPANSAAPPAFRASRAGMIDALEYKGNLYDLLFPACRHPEHHTIECPVLR
jgi:hypothetical protein